MKNYFIILRGPAGVGKTSVGKELSKKLKGYYVPFSQILKKNNLHYKGGKSIPEKNFFKANEIIAPVIMNKLKKGKNVILESNFYHKSPIKDLIKKINFSRVLVFTLKASLKNLILRDKFRDKKKKIGKERVISVYKLVKKFDYGIILNTNNKNKKEVMSEIKSFLK
ncbi:MAG: AAA family ATPase [Nanoarchaeota archaeon]